MAEMKELITVEQAERAIRTLALVLPPIGLIVGALVGAVGRRPGRGLLVGLLCGLAGPAVFGLWQMYNAVMGVYGLDSVRGLLVNLALFVAVGVVAGLLIGVLWRRMSAAAEESADSSLRSER